MKKIIFCFIVLLFSMGVIEARANVLFEYRRQEVISRGVTYELIRQMTQNGMLDIHLLLIDMTDPYLYIGPVANWQEMGRRATTSAMLERAGAIAGVNADFFDMGAAFTNHFGPMISDGEVIALNNYTNTREYRYFTVLIDHFNNVFFAPMNTGIRLTLNGEPMHTAGISQFNNIGRELEWPILIDRNGYRSTHEISSRFPGLAFVVFDQGFVSAISLSDVFVPEDGYVLILPARMISNRYQFQIGDTIEVEFLNSMGLDFSLIRSAVGGGAMILLNGELVSNAMSPPPGRQPRSAVGISACGTVLILMVVDGRTHSIGASHADTANLLLRFGAFNAMHLDSGGSSTMAHTGSGSMRVTNRPSDGSQRQVANALGVFDRSVMGPIAGLRIDVPSAIVGLPVNIRVYAQDVLWNRLYIPSSEVVFIGDGGVWHEGTYTPLTPGLHAIQANFSGFTSIATFNVQPLAEINIRPSSIEGMPGARTRLSFGGVLEDGSSINNLNVTDITVTPSNLGTIENGVFTAVTTGAGFLTARIGETIAHIPVSVGGMPWPIEPSEDIEFLSYPAGVTGSVGRDEFETGIVYRLNYRFFETNVTQVAHLGFSVQLPGNPVGIRMLVYGNDSGHWLRGRVIDANGNTHNIDFVDRINFLGWTEVTALIPTNAPAPFTLQRIYAAALSHGVAMDYNLSFTNLEALFAPNDHIDDIPQSTTFNDPLRVSPNFIGTQSIDIPIPTERQSYSSNTMGNTIIINISAIGGGISAANRNQWGLMTQDLNTFLGQNVIIVFDDNPRTAFNSSHEYELFHLAMTQQRDFGRTVFVVSATENETRLAIRDGIRYINIDSRIRIYRPYIRFWLEQNKILWSDL